MEMLTALVVFGILLAIALIGLVISNRQARNNNASRHAGGPTLHPRDQSIMRTEQSRRDQL